MTGVPDTAPPAAENAVGAALLEYHRTQVEGCTRCRLAETRTQVVPGNGSPTARLMFVGEAPGYHEDRRGYPFCGAAGQLLDSLLEGIGLTRDDVFVANVLKCRPPGNRDPQADEIAACEPHLFQQVRLIRPAMICSLGNFATKLLSGRTDGISRVHGCELPIEVGGTRVLLYPVYHPAAALYTPAMRATLEEDFARIPELLGIAQSDAPLTAPEVPQVADAVGAAPQHPAPPPASPAAETPAEQLGLF